MTAPRRRATKYPHHVRVVSPTRMATRPKTTPMTRVARYHQCGTSMHLVNSAPERGEHSQTFVLEHSD